MNGHLISIPEAVDLLGVSKYFIYKAIASGTLKAKDFEGRTYVIRSTIEDYINKQ